MGLVITLIVIVVVVLILGGIVVSLYNRMVRGRNLVEQSWNQIDVELNRRYDLIPNLVNTIKAATSYEKSTLESVVGLREQATALASQKADPTHRAEVEDQLSRELQNLVTVTVEAYPQLQANAGFLDLQKELSDVESRIANARKYYNANVGNYNTLIESFPNSLLTGIGHFVRADYFQIQDPGVRATPVVNFDAAAPAAGPSASPAIAPVAPPPLPAQPAAPFAPPPAEPGDFAQPDFSRSSGVPDQK